MEIKHKHLPNKIDEHYILPICFLLVNVSLVIWFYVLHEYTKTDEAFIREYNFSKSEIGLYLDDLRTQLIVFTILLLLTPLYLKFRKRWLLLLLTLLHFGALYYFFYLR